MQQLIEQLYKVKYNIHMHTQTCMYVCVRTFN